MMVLKVFLLLSLLSCAGTKTFQLIEGETRSDHESKSKDYMIATQGKAASKAAIKMFDRGGNAFDAFAAASFVISVERPQSTGIGGGGFATIFRDGDDEPVTVDFREVAPQRSSPGMYLDKDGNLIRRLSLDGVEAGGVPGLVAGVLEIHEKYGKLSREDILTPAIELAEKGFPVYEHLARAIDHRKSVLALFPESKKVFFKGEEPLKLGDIIIQKDLAWTLKQIRKLGRDGFYKHDVARKIITSMKKWNGPIRVKDLENYKVKWRAPVKGSFRGHDIYSMGPPSSGGTHIIQILNILENDPIEKWGPFSTKTIHLTASAMQRAFIDRAYYMGDSDFVKIPLKRLTSKDYAKNIRQKINMDSFTPASEAANDIIPGYESSETTHFTIMDKKGNTISSTQTINGLLGSAFVIGGTGIVLNNEMDDFTTKVGEQNLFGAVGGEKNEILPGKRPLSSMSPTIVMKDKRPVLALGSPNGTKILTCVAQTMLNYLAFKMPLYESVSSLRYHQQWRPDHLRVEEGLLNASDKKALEKKGHTVLEKDYGCKVQAIAHEGEWLHGVSDPRGIGLAIGR